MSEAYRVIQELVGEGSALALVDRLGGKRIWISCEQRSSSPLVLAIGRQAAEKVARVFGGGSLDVPSRLAIETKDRQAQVVEDLISGTAVNEIAYKHGISRRQVFRIQKRYLQT